MVATIAAAFLGFGAAADDDENPLWTIEPLKAGDFHRVTMAENSFGINFVRNSQTNAIEQLREELRRDVVFVQRMLPFDDEKAALPFRTVSLFQKLASERKTKDRTLSNFELGETAKLVVMEPRSATFANVWSPRGPLLQPEFHTLSYLVFVPALNGLLPKGPVRWGDRWKPTTAVLAHLCNFMPLQKSDVECVCRQTVEFGGERLLQIAVKGTLAGVDPELGQATDELEGGLYIRPQDRSIHSLNLRARRLVADDRGQPVADWKIDFKMNLKALAAADAPPELAAAVAARPQPLDLALHAPYLPCGVDVVYPRAWAPGKADRQLFQLVNGVRNEEMVLVFEPDGKTPTIKEYADRVRAELAAAKDIKAATFEGDPQEKSVGEAGSEGYGYAGQFVVRLEKAGVPRALVYQVLMRGGRGVSARTICAPENVAGCIADTQLTLKNLRFTTPTLPAAPAGK